MNKIKHLRFVLSVNEMSTSTVEVNNKRSIPADDQQFHPRKQLRIEIPRTLQSSPTLSTAASLFSAASLPNDVLHVDALPTIYTCRKPAMAAAPPIPGLYFSSTLRIPIELADSVTSFCMSTYFNNPNINQIMLFTRFSPETPSSLPPILLRLLDALSPLLKPHIPPPTHNLLFPSQPTQARQVILNLYTPGEGISPHIDLLKRFGDGIISVSLGSGCVMRFAKASNSELEDHGPGRTSILDEPTHTTDAYEDGSKRPDIYDLYLPERSVIVLSSDARFKWTHEIEKRKSDFVARSASLSQGDSPLLTDSPDLSGYWIDRDIRLSITFRWLLPGADIVGINDSHPDTEWESI